jgi:hypothetical protein
LCQRSLLNIASTACRFNRYGERCRAFYFALEGLVDRFVYLPYGLAVILVFVGVKFVAQGKPAHDVRDIPVHRRWQMNPHLRR